MAESIQAGAPKITIYTLEMTSPTQLKECADTMGLHVVEAIVKQYQFNRFLYQLVGSPCSWTEKLKWSEAQWREFAEDPNLRTWVAYNRGSPAGYFELHKQAQGDVEIKTFGLAEKFIGQGFGGYLLSQAVRSAWFWCGTKRVWLQTCTLDHPAALHNYRARGFQLCGEVTESKRG